MDDNQAPIYVQIADWIETQILEDKLMQDDKVYSQYQLAERFNINPATAGKGITRLFEKDLLYKKRGLGMFVCPHAKEAIMKNRRQQLLDSQMEALIREATLLEINQEQLIRLLVKKYEEEST